MSDLIDLTSPENKKIQPPKLSSPLIPVPKDDVESNKADSMAVPARRSLNDNPFDVALQKTNEYIRKCQDPFEIVFEKAINHENKNESEPRLSASSKDDYCCKRSRHPDAVKMNKTFTDSQSPNFSNILNNQSSSLSHWKNYAITDLANTLPSEVLRKKSIPESSVTFDKKNMPLISIDPPTPNFDLSILNQSMLNNTFSDEYGTERPSIGKFLNKTTASCIGETSILNQSAMNDSLSGSGSSDDGLIKSIVNHRIDSCIKQALEKTEIHSDKLTDQYHKLRRSLSQGDEIAVGKLRKMQSQSTNESKNFSILNNKSSILREEDFNNGFLKTTAARFSTTSEVSTISTISAISRLNSALSYTASFGDSDNPINNAFIKSCLSLTSETPQKRQKSITTNSRIASANSLTKISDLADQFNILKLKSNNFYSVGTPISNQEKCNISNDSVFTEDAPIHNTLNLEQLEQSKSHTSNSSVGEDLLPKKLPDDLDLSLENEIHVDNLIELHTSNSFNNTESNPCENNQSLPQKKEDVKIDTVKELEQELIEPEKKPVAATLLMELQKLIKTKNNPKAAELLEKLEEYLGVKCHSNVELLEMCFHNANESKEHVDINKADQVSSKAEKSKVNVSEEDNVNIELNDNLKRKDSISNIKKNLNNDEKINKGNKALTVSGEVECEEKKPDNLFGTQKLIMDIQLALRQLLTDYNGEPTLFLENLKKVINPIPNEKTVEKVKNKKTLSSRVSLSPKKSSGLVNRSLKSPMRQSFGSNSVKKLPSIKRRASISQIPETNIPKAEVKSRADSPKKEIKKRISSYGESSLEKNKVKIEPQPIKIKSSVPVFNKTKLKKKSEVDAPVKKGPLKAVIPLGNMQRKTTVGMKVSIVVEPTTPPKSSHHTSSFRPGSTPIREQMNTLERIKTSKKVKPVASSTPEIANKSLNIKERVSSSPRHNMSWNISPVTPNPSLNSSNVGKNNPIKRIQSDKVLVPSPKARNVTPRRLEQTSEISKHSNVLNNSLKNTSSKINHSRYSEPVKNNGINKSVAAEKSHKSIQSPLKEKNSPVLKNKLNLSISKLRRHSASITTTEKENKAKK
ncbi:uncharacterized protein [Chelonus insularis]|uniref:uncharacterized protein n=1 Tax=Chelonus insularis TaxID=460826 RepID=UPI00158A60EF|nr:uncharacterized protein LOC118071321 [Chelonus insularis]